MSETTFLRPIPANQLLEEIQLIEYIYPGSTLDQIQRKSAKRYDVRFCGTTSNGVAFSAWLPLAVIMSHDWPALASLSDLPNLVRAGAWSGIRDSSEAAIWAMFHVAHTRVRKILKRA